MPRRGGWFDERGVSGRSHDRPVSIVREVGFPGSVLAQFAPAARASVGRGPRDSTAVTPGGCAHGHSVRLRPSQNQRAEFGCRQLHRSALSARRNVGHVGQFVSKTLKRLDRIRTGLACAACAAALRSHRLHRVTREQAKAHRERSLGSTTTDCSTRLGICHRLKLRRSTIGSLTERTRPRSQLLPTSLQETQGYSSHVPHKVDSGAAQIPFPNGIVSVPSYSNTPILN